jgi:DNA polymerase
MNKKLHIDIETYSSIDIKTAGAYKYMESVDFEILMTGFAFDDEPVELIDMAQGEQLPKRFIEGLNNPSIEKHAHNANFERRAFIVYGYDVDAAEWRCSAVKAAYCGLPSSLDGASKALKLGDDGKSAAGKALIKFFSCPIKGTKKNDYRVRNFPHHDLEKWEEFKQYCIQDVEAEREIDNRLLQYEIPEFERQNYILDQKINDKGIMTDLVLAQSAYDVDMTFTNGIKAEVKKITGLDNPNSPAQLKKWLSAKMRKEIKTLAKDGIGDLIDEAGPGDVTDVLNFRRKLGKTSTKKYLAMLKCTCDDGRAHGLLQFYGASRTGRWAGRLVQLQNLPQNHLTDLAEARTLIRSGDYDHISMVYDDISSVLSQLIRTALVAKPNHTFAVADFSAIEARVIAWLAGEKWREDVFRSHGKIYESSASMMFNVPIEKVTKGSDLRAKGKVAELALGYQGAVGALMQMGGEKMGLSEMEMKAIVTKWRKASPNIVALWKDMENCAKISVRGHKKVISKFKGIEFDCDKNALTVKLPSGRKLFYWNPVFKKNQWGNDAIAYRGIDSVTKQWLHIDTYGGKLTENIVQAIARDLLALSMLNLDAKGYDIVMHVHDEAACEIPFNEQTNEDTLEDMCRIMGIEAPWAKGLPLAADGYLTPFYKKD